MKKYKVVQGAKIIPMNFEIIPTNLDGWRIARLGNSLLAKDDWYFTDQDILPHSPMLYYHIKLSCECDGWNAFYTHCDNVICVEWE